jgi:hypothetical protein
VAVSVVQTAPSANAVGTAVTCTFPSAVTAGNTICASVAVQDGGTSAFTVAFTLGSSPDNWLLHRQARRSAGGSNIYTAEWADTGCAGGVTAVTCTLTGASGGVLTSMMLQVYEVSGLPGAAEDGTGANNGNSSSFSTGSFTPNSTTTTGDEFWWGSVTYPSSTTITPPSGWTNTSPITTSLGQAMVAGYQVRATTGTPLYSGTFFTNVQWACAGSTLKAGTKQGTASLSGHGTVTAAGGIAGAASLSGAGGITAAGTGGPPDTAGLVGEGTISALGGVQIAATADLSGAGAVTAGSAPVAPVTVVNQWAGTIAHGPAFAASAPPSSPVQVTLNHASSVGGGTGIPTQGNWLFVLAGWRQDPGATGVTVNISGNDHQWFRPNSPSTDTGNTRTTVWYQPNIGAATIVPDTIWVQPNGYVAGMSVLILEVSGLGPWDYSVGASVNYHAATTSLSLSLTL